MQKSVKEQLDESSLQYSEIGDLTYYIPMQIPLDELPLEVGKYYIIELEDYIIHPYDGFTLHDNWNKGIIPKSKQMKCVVNKIMGKMVQIDGCGYIKSDDKDLDDMYYGLWLPAKSVKILGII